MDLIMEVRSGNVLAVLGVPPILLSIMPLALYGPGMFKVMEASI